MRIQQLLLLGAMLPLAACGPRPDADSFDLEVTLTSPFNTHFAMRTTVHNEKPFEFAATNGVVVNKVSGTLHAPADGVYPLEVNFSEWESKGSHVRDSCRLDLELGKTNSSTFGASAIYTRSVVLRKHE